MLAELGWNDDLTRAFAPWAEKGCVPARLNRETPINYGAFVDDHGKLRDLDVVLSGKVWHDAATDADLPAVGDWVALDPGDDLGEPVIRARLPRRSRFSRKVPGKSVEEQVIGANVDVVAIVTDPGPDHNPRRIERYLALIGRGGARPLVLVNKADHFPAEIRDRAAAEILALDPRLDVHLVSALDGTGLDVLKRHLAPGITMCIVGSSGVGKSTLVNRLLGEPWQWTGEVNRVTGKGRHTTTMRELVPLPGGGLLIDNPGMREIQMWTDERTLRESFTDIEALAARCRFHDCRHGTDAGCAIRAAVDAGALDPARLDSFLRLDDEIERLRRRAKKRRINVERRAKRAHRVKARNLADRIEHEREQRGEWR